MHLLVIKALCNFTGIQLQHNIILLLIITQTQPSIFTYVNLQILILCVFTVYNSVHVYTDFKHFICIYVQMGFSTAVTVWSLTSSVSEDWYGSSLHELVTLAICHSSILIQPISMFSLAYNIVFIWDPVPNFIWPSNFGHSVDTCISYFYHISRGALIFSIVIGLDSRSILIWNTTASAENICF